MRAETRVRGRWRLYVAAALAEIAFVPGVPTLIAWLLDGVLIQVRRDGAWRTVESASDVLDRVDPREVER